MRDLFNFQQLFLDFTTYFESFKILYSLVFKSDSIIHSLFGAIYTVVIAQEYLLTLHIQTSSITKNYILYFQIIHFIF